MNNLQVLVRCYDKVAQNPGFRCPTLTSVLGYERKFRPPPRYVCLLRWSHFVGQFSGAAKVYSGV
jgi:hypothetical protein